MNSSNNVLAVVSMQIVSACLTIASGISLANGSGPTTAKKLMFSAEDTCTVNDIQRIAIPSLPVNVNFSGAARYSYEYFRHLCSGTYPTNRDGICGWRQYRCTYPI